MLALFKELLFLCSCCLFRGWSCNQSSGVGAVGARGLDS